MQTICREIVGRRRSRAVIVLLTVTLGAGTLAACGTTPATPPVIDGVKLEQRLTEDASRAGMSMRAVTCPHDRVARAGDRFACTADLSAGGSLTYDVDITSETGSYRYKLSPGQVLDGAAAATLLTADVAAASPAVADAKVTCPTTVLSPTATTTFECTLTAASATAKIVVTNTRGEPLDWQFKG